MTKTEKIIDSLQQLVKRNYSDRLFDEINGEIVSVDDPDIDDLMPGLIGGSYAEVVKIIDNIINDDNYEYDNYE